MAGFSPIKGPGLPGEELLKKAKNEANKTKKEAEEKILKVSAVLNRPTANLEKSVKKIDDAKKRAESEKRSVLSDARHIKKADDYKLSWGLNAIKDLPDANVKNLIISNNKKKKESDDKTEKGVLAWQNKALREALGVREREAMEHYDNVTRNQVKHLTSSEIYKLVDENIKTAQENNSGVVVNDAYNSAMKYKNDSLIRIAKEKAQEEKYTYQDERFKPVEQKYGIDRSKAMVKDIKELIAENKDKMSVLKAQGFSGKNEYEALKSDNEILKEMVKRDSFYRETDDEKMLNSYNALADNEDFYSKTYINPNEKDRVYGYINESNSKGRFLRENDKIATEEKSGYEIYVYMDSKERAIFNYLYNTEGIKGAKEYLKFLESELLKRETGEKVKEAKEYAIEHPILSSLGTVIGAPARGVAGAISTVGDTANVLLGKDIEQNSKLKQLAHVSRAVRDTVSNDVIDSDLGRFFYNSGVSLLDNVIEGATMFLLAGPFGAAASKLDDVSDVYKVLKAVRNISKHGTSLMVSGDVAVNSILDAKAKGYSDKKALGLGFAYATAEYITEKYALDYIFDSPTRGIKKGLFSMASEGGSEGASAGAGLLIDYMVNGSDSDIKKRIEDLKLEGYSDKGACITAIAESILPEMAAGALSGGAMHGMYSISPLSKFDAGNKTSKPTFDDVVNMGNDKSNDNGNYESDEKNVYYMASDIERNMPEDRRTEILRSVSIPIIRFDGATRLDREQGIKNASKVMREYAEDLGILGKHYIEDVEFDVNYSKNSVKESVHKQEKNFQDFDKMLSVFKDVVRNAKVIEKHDDKYKGTDKENKNLEQTHVLVSAIDDGESIIPIKMDVKEYKAHSDNNLYVTITLAKINKEDMVLTPVPTSVKDEGDSARISSMISIPELLKNINSDNGNFLKYFPDEMLSDAQRQSKWNVLDRTSRLANQDYLKSVEDGDMKSAQKMVDEAAKRWGALTDDNGDVVYAYRGDNKKGKTVFDSKEHYDDIIFTSTSEGVGNAYKGDGEVYKFYVKDEGLLRVEGNYGVAQDVLVPKELEGVNIENKAKATVNEIGIMARKAGYKGVYVKNIRDGSGFIWADDIVVFEGGSQLKSAAPVTYDNKGAVIPLSERFNSGNDDIRYSVSDNNGGVDFDALINLKPYVRENKEDVSFQNFKKASERLGFKVISSPRVDVLTGVPSDVKVDGYVDFDNREVYINPKAKDKQNVLLKHELTHVLQDTSDKYLIKAKEYIKETFPEEWEKVRQKVEEKYKDLSIKSNGEIKSTPERIEAEAMAEFSSILATDDAINRYGRGDSGIIRNISFWFSYLSKKVKSVLGDLTTVEKLEMASQKWEIALKKAEKRDGKSRNSGATFSVVENLTDTDGVNHGKCVLLDSNFFDGLSPRNWGKKLKDYLYNRASKDTSIMPIEDENGNMQMLEFAKPNENIFTKNGNRRRVLDELWTTNDNISKLSTIHIDEIIPVSEEGNPYHTESNNHEWLDQNGWLHRTAKVVNAKNGAIYEIILDIGKSADGRIILYATNGNIKRVGSVEVDSINKILKGPRQNTYSTSSISQNGGNSNKNLNFSFSDNESGGNVPFSSGNLFDGSAAETQQKNTDLGENISKTQQKNTDLGENISKTQQDVQDAQNKRQSIEDIESELDRIAERLSDENLTIEEEDELLSRQLKLEAKLRARKRVREKEIERINNARAKVSAGDDLSGAEGGLPKAQLERYRETGNSGELPTRAAAVSSKKSYEESAKGYAEEISDIEDILHAKRCIDAGISDENITLASSENIELAKSMSADDELAMRKRLEALHSKWKSSLLKVQLEEEIIDALKNIDTRARPNHMWVNDISHDLSDKSNFIKYGTYGMNDFERNVRHFFGKKYFKLAYDKIIKPLYESKGRFADGVSHYSDLVYEKIVKELGIEKGSKLSAAVQWLGEGQKPISDAEGADLAPYTYEDCVKEFGEETAKKIKEASLIFRKFYDELLDSVNETRSMLYPNNPDKLIHKRKDYFRHFEEMSEGFRGLSNILGNDQVGIDPMLVGVSETTKPKSKWQSFAQERVGARTKYDAVGGFLEYLPQAMYSIHIDPNIVNIRSLAYDLASAKASEGAGGNPNANGFIMYLQKYANHLAGKTVSHFDRMLADSASGRKVIKVLSWFNNRVKSNVVLGNVSTIFSQFANMINMHGEIQKESDILKGTVDTFRGFFRNKAVLDNYSRSAFLKERFLSKKEERFDSNLSPKKWAVKMLGLADEIGTRVTWNSAFNEAVRLKTDNPFQYADDITRRCVAGRGIGETPLMFQGQLAKLFLPFRVEVMNNINVIQDVLFDDSKDTKGKNARHNLHQITKLFVFSAIANVIIASLKGDEFNPEDDIEKGFSEGSNVWERLGLSLKELGLDWVDGYGDGVALDPLHDIASGIYEGVTEGEDAYSKAGLSFLRPLQNLAGDIVSNHPLGTAALGVSGTDNDTAKALFNDKVYLSGGLGMPAMSTLSSAAKKAAKGDVVSGGADILKSFALPFGGSQIDKTARGLYEYFGGAQTKNAYERMAGKKGKLKYLVEPTPENFLKSVLFGPSSFSGANDEYYNNKALQLSEKETENVYAQEGYENRKATFDDIINMKRYNQGNQDRKSKAEDEFFGDNDSGALYEMYKNGDESAIPYRNIPLDLSITIDKTKYEDTLKPDKANEMGNRLSDRLFERFSELDDAPEFVKLTKEEREKILDKFVSYERNMVKAEYFHEKGDMSDEEFFEYETSYKRNVAKAERDLYVENPESFVKFNALDMEKQYFQYGDNLTEETKRQVRKYSEHAMVKEPDNVDLELMRVSNLTGSDINASGNPSGVLSYSKDKQEYYIDMPDTKVYEFIEYVDSSCRNALAEVFETSEYKNASISVKKDIISDVKASVRAEIKKLYKSKYKSVKIDVLDALVNMK